MVKVAAPKPMPPSAAETATPSAQATAPPMAKPSPAVSSDSTRNETRIEPREKPIARSVPISAVRAWTAAYIVFVAPKTAPIPASTARPITST